MKTESKALKRARNLSKCRIGFIICMIVAFILASYTGYLQYTKYWKKIPKIVQWARQINPTTENEKIMKSMIMYQQTALKREIMSYRTHMIVIIAMSGFSMVYMYTLKHLIKEIDMKK